MPRHSLRTRPGREYFTCGKPPNEHSLCTQWRPGSDGQGATRNRHNVTFARILVDSSTSRTQMPEHEMPLTAQGPPNQNQTCMRKHTRTRVTLTEWCILKLQTTLQPDSVQTGTNRNTNPYLRQLSRSNVATTAPRQNKIGPMCPNATQAGNVRLGMPERMHNACACER